MQRRKANWRNAPLINGLGEITQTVFFATKYFESMHVITTDSHCMSPRLFQVHVHQVFVVLENSECPSDITIAAVLCLPPYFQSILRLTASSHLSKARQCIHICWLVPLSITHIALKYVLLMQWRVSSKPPQQSVDHLYIFKICLYFFFFF